MSLVGRPASRAAITATVNPLLLKVVLLGWAPHVDFSGDAAQTVRTGMPIFRSGFVVHEDAWVTAGCWQLYDAGTLSGPARGRGNGLRFAEVRGRSSPAAGIRPQVDFVIRHGHAPTALEVVASTAGVRALDGNRPPRVGEHGVLNKFGRGAPVESETWSRYVGRGRFVKS